MNECIQIGKDVNLSEVLAKLPGAAWMFLERVPSSWLERAEQDDGLRLTTFAPQIDWGCWERGRIFCDAWELRWEGGEVTYTGPPTDLPGFQQSSVLLSPSSRREASYVLWGRRAGDRFLELQVARVLRYPFHSGRVLLDIVEWLGEASEPVASRCVRLKEAK